MLHSCTGSPVLIVLANNTQTAGQQKLVYLPVWQDACILAMQKLQHTPKHETHAGC